MGVACERQAHARWHADEYVRLVRQQDHRVVRRHLAERARQVVFAAKRPAPEPVRQLVSRPAIQNRAAPSPTRTARFSRQGMPTF